MLGTYPKAFSQGYLPKWQPPKFAISQAANFQVYGTQRSAYSIPSYPQRIGPQLHAVAPLGT